MILGLFSFISGNGFLGNNLSSSSAISSSWGRVFQMGCSSNGVRTIWTFSPLCMGRRSSKIAGRKVCRFLFLSFFFWEFVHSFIVLVRIIYSMAGSDYYRFVYSHWLYPGVYWEFDHLQSFSAYHLFDESPKLEIKTDGCSSLLTEHLQCKRL